MTQAATDRGDQDAACRGGQPVEREDRGFRRRSSAPPAACARSALCRPATARSSCEREMPFRTGLRLRQPQMNTQTLRMTHGVQARTRLRRWCAPGRLRPAAALAASAPDVQIACGLPDPGTRERKPSRRPPATMSTSHGPMNSRPGTARPRSCHRRRESRARSRSCRGSRQRPRSARTARSARRTAAAGRSSR